MALSKERMAAYQRKRRANLAALKADLKITAPAYAPDSLEERLADLECRVRKIEQLMRPNELYGP